MFSQLLARSTPEHSIVRLESGRQLFEDEAQRWCCYPTNAVQGVLLRAAPETLLLPNQQAMALGVGLPRQINKVLDLGTGCGGILRFLAAAVPQASLRSIDSDREMLALARRHFALPAAAEVRLGDAFPFLRQDTQHYDLIVCDVFDGRAEPPWLSSQEVFPALRARLAPDGAVALNLLPTSEAQLRSQLLQASQCFAGIAVCQFGTIGNIVALLQTQALPPMESWVSRCRAVLGTQAEHLLPWMTRFRRVPGDA